MLEDHADSLACERHLCLQIGGSWWVGKVERGTSVQYRLQNEDKGCWQRKTFLFLSTLNVRHSSSEFRN